MSKKSKGAPQEFEAECVLKLREHSTIGWFSTPPDVNQPEIVEARDTSVEDFGNMQCCLYRFQILAPDLTNTKVPQITVPSS